MQGVYFTGPKLYSLLCSTRGSYSCIPLLNVSASTGYPTLLNPYSRPSYHLPFAFILHKHHIRCCIYDLRSRKYVVKEANSKNGIQRSIKRSMMYINGDG